MKLKSEEMALKALAVFSATCASSIFKCCMVWALTLSQHARKARTHMELSPLRLPCSTAERLSNNRSVSMSHV